MTTPRTCFLDTSILAGQQYNLPPLPLRRLLRRPSNGTFDFFCPTLPSARFFARFESARRKHLRLSKLLGGAHLLDRASATLEESVNEVAAELGFYHSNEKYKEIEDIDQIVFNVDEVNVVALGVDSCTITFSGALTYRVRLRWEEPSYYGGWEEPEMMSERVSDTATITGTAKVQFRPDLTSVDEISYVELDDREIEVTAESW